MRPRSKGCEADSRNPVRYLQVCVSFSSSDEYLSKQYPRLEG